MRRQKTITDPDHSLITRMAQGDSKALKDLMTLYIGPLHAHSYRLLGDHMKAEDICQIVFLKIWDMAPQWQFGRGTLKAYLYRIATHRCLDLLRKRQESLPGELPERIDPTQNADHQLMMGDEAQMVKAALDTLPPRQKAAITLFYYQELSLKEAAHTLDMSESAFESLLRRARTSLKQDFSQKNLLNDHGFLQEEALS